MKKKTVSLLLSLAMCLTMLPGQSVFAAETSTETETEAASESTGNHVENLIDLRGSHGLFTVPEDFQNILFTSGGGPGFSFCGHSGGTSFLAAAEKLFRMFFNNKVSWLLWILYQNSGNCQ